MSKETSPVGLRIQPPLAPAAEPPPKQAADSEATDSEATDSEATDDSRTETRPPPRMRTGLKIGLGRAGGWDGNHALSLR